jgi:hypothetical protein
MRGVANWNLMVPRAASAPRSPMAIAVIPAQAGVQCLQIAR